VITVRQATENDVSTLVTFGTKFHQAHRAGPWDAKKLPALCSLLIKDHVALLAEWEGWPIGALVAVKTTSIFDSDAPMYQELAWWIEPDYRSAGAGTVLLDAFELVVGTTPALLTILPTTAAELAWFEARGWRVQQTTLARNF
jgi:hypothetical protein